MQGNGPDAGVGGFSEAGSGVIGQSNSGSGIMATSDTSQGVTAFSNKSTGLFAQGPAFSAVLNDAVVVNPCPPLPGTTPSDTNGCLVLNKGDLHLNEGNFFVKGNVNASGDILLTNPGLAENFDVPEADLEERTVMVLAEDGTLSDSSMAYDRCVAGVLAGAGRYRPAIVLDRQPHATGRRPLAMVGKIYCKVVADDRPITVGDLLTTSGVAGHAMKALDRERAFGSVIGKALATLQEGTGLIPILEALQ